MENAEGILQTLEEYLKLKPNDIPSELNEYLVHVAKTGDPVFQWSVVKCLFRDKLAKTITEFYESCPAIDLPPCPNVDAFNYEALKSNLLERLDSFSSAPFTVQRICELLINPRKEYSRVDKYMRAIEKNILVVSTKEPGIPKRPEGIQQEPVVNGVIESRGVELGEAIETVSSDGVNLMHADNSDVSVSESVRLLDCSSTEEGDAGERTNRPLASIKPWQKHQPTVLLVTGESKSNEIKEQQDILPSADKMLENNDFNNTESTKTETLVDNDTSAENVESFNQVIVNEVAEQGSSSKNGGTLLQDDADKAVFDVNLAEIASNKSPVDDAENNIPPELEGTTENIVSEAIAIVEENIKKECESDEPPIVVSQTLSEVCEKHDQLCLATEPVVESISDNLDETAPVQGTVITVRENLTESSAEKDVTETCSVTVTEIASTLGEIPENSISSIESRIVHGQDDNQAFIVVEDSAAATRVEPATVAEDLGVLASAEQPPQAEASSQNEQSADQLGDDREVVQQSGATVAGRIEEDLCTESNDMEPVEIESAVEQDEAMDVDETSLPMEVAMEEEPMDQSEEMPGGGGGS